MQDGWHQSKSEALFQLLVNSKVLWCSLFEDFLKEYSTPKESLVYYNLPQS